MDTLKKRTIYFFILYLVCNFSSTLLVYSWTSFGGRNSMNFMQKFIYVFFNYPSKYLNLEDIIFSNLFNGIFWSLLFYFIIKLYQKIVEKG